MQHKLIMENWRNFLEQPGDPFLIYERKGKIEQVNFQHLLKEVDRGKVSHEQAYLIFERAFEYGERQLIEEGIFDLIKKGYDKAGEILSNIGEDIKAAWKKASDFYLNMMIKAMDLASRGIEFFSKYARKVLDAIDRFQEKHPILYKIIVAVIIILIIYALFGSSNAQAAVQVGDKTMTDGEYKAVQGVLETASRNAPVGDVGFRTAVGEAQVALQQAHQAGESINMNELAPSVQEAWNVVDTTLNTASQGNQAAAKMFNRWFKLGDALKITSIGM